MAGVYGDKYKRPLQAGLNLERRERYERKVLPVYAGKIRERSAKSFPDDFGDRLSGSVYAWNSSFLYCGDIVPCLFLLQDAL